MRKLETLQTVARFGFFPINDQKTNRNRKFGEFLSISLSLDRFSHQLPDDIENGIDELGALGVVTLRPVVTGARLAEYEIVRSENLTEWTGSHRVHRTRFQIDQNGARYIFATCVNKRQSVNTRITEPKKLKKKKKNLL